MPEFSPYASIGSIIYFIVALLFARFSYMLIAREINRPKPQKRLTKVK